MKVSTRGRYGLRAMVDIAARMDKLDETGCVNLRTIAASQGISENYLGQLVINLKKAELITSVRGAKGGYVLSRPASEITTWDILTALEGDMSPVSCANSVDGVVCSGEGCDSNCAIRPVWFRFHQRVREEAESITLQELVDGYRERVAGNGNGNGETKA